jgi:DNA-binding beta-propeller fold protein YncE
MRLLCVFVTAVAVVAASGAAARGDPVEASSVAPSLYGVVGHLGWGMEGRTGARVCAAASAESCRPAASSVAAGGFSYPSSVASNPRNGDLLVADLDNHRVQRFGPAGDFVAMFGGEVNRTKDAQAGATAVQKDLCTAASGDTCGAGVAGSAPGQLAYPTSIAVDPLTGDVYVVGIDRGDYRVDEYTAQGRFLLRIGEHVNASTKGNTCSALEMLEHRARCAAGAERRPYDMQAAAFKFAPQYGDLLAVGGPEHLLYVGDEHRVQEFDARGGWKREILLASLSAARGSGVTSLAVDAHGDLYLVYRTVDAVAGNPEHVDVVRELSRQGVLRDRFAVIPRLPGTEAHIDGIAIGPMGSIAVIGVEIGTGFHQRFGLLYDSRTGSLVGEFPPPRDNDGLTFDALGRLYVAATDDQEVTVYARQVSRLFSSPAPCLDGQPQDRSVAFNCTLDE